MEFEHVDVFADEAFSGISLTAFISDGSLTAPQLLTIAQEVRHFESAFLTATDNPHRWRAQVLDLAGGLDLAVVSTGLRYLLIPVFGGRLQAVGALFAYLLDLVSGEVIEGEDRHGPGTYVVFAPGSRHRPPHSEGSADLRDHHPVKPCRAAGRPLSRPTRSSAASSPFP